MHKRAFLIAAGFIAALLTALGAASAQAGEVRVVDAKAKASNGGYNFSVTLRHADTGWKHYADQWQVLAPNGAVLGTRVLVHPHVDEQPFTRGLSGVKVPKGIKQVLIRARDSVHGHGPETYPVDLPGR